MMIGYLLKGVGPILLSGDEVIFYGYGRSFCPVSDQQLGVNVTYMGFNGGRADHQLLGDLVVGQAFDQ